MCAAVGPEVLSKGRIKILTGTGAGVLRVGRLDNIRPSPPGNLPPNHADLTSFAKFWKERGFSEAEATALMGSHALIDTQVRADGFSTVDVAPVLVNKLLSVEGHNET